MGSNTSTYTAAETAAMQTARAGGTDGRPSGPHYLIRTSGATAERLTDAALCDLIRAEPGRWIARITKNPVPETDA